MMVPEVREYVPTLAVLVPSESLRVLVLILPEVIVNALETVMSLVAIFKVPADLFTVRL